MPPARLRVIIVLLAVAGPAAAQPDRPPPPPATALGEPDVRAPLFDLNNPLAPLGPPDQPFRPFAPLGPPPAIACEGIGTRFGLGILAGRFGLPGYGVSWVPAQPVAGQTTDLAVLRQDLSLFAPIYRQGADTAAVGVGVHNSLFWTDAVLPTSHRPFPDQLWDIEAGLSYSHQWDNGWTTGVTVTAGSASDRPFEHGDALVGSLTVYNAFPAEGRDAWVLGATYAPASETPYPLPIAFYYWQPSDDVQVGIGLPFFLRWHFLPEWTLEGLWVPIRTVSARVTWSNPERPGFKAYGAFDWSNESYLLSDRIDNGDRFFAYEKRLSAGVQLDMPYKLRLDLSAGYLFDRFYFQGQKYGDRNRDRVNVGSGLFGAVQLRLQF
jgi:hypothetical protein